MNKEIFEELKTNYTGQQVEFNTASEEGIGGKLVKVTKSSGLKIEIISKLFKET